MKRCMVFVLMILLMLLSALVGANAGTLTTFAVPDARLTVPVGINPAGTIAGYYSDEASRVTASCGFREDQTERSEQPRPASAGNSAP